MPVADLAPRRRRLRPWTEEERLAAKRARVEAGYVFTGSGWPVGAQDAGALGGARAPGALGTGALGALGTGTALGVGVTTTPLFRARALSPGGYPEGGSRRRIHVLRTCCMRAGGWIRLAATP